MALDVIVDKQGALAQTLNLFHTGTIQHADEITGDRRNDEVLRDKWFYTADHALYMVEDGERILYLGRKDTNPLSKNIEEAIRQLAEGKYVPTQEDIEAIVNAESTLRINLSDLRLKEEGEYADLDIDTANLETLNPTEKLLAERAYGSMEKRPGVEFSDFEMNMKMLRDNGIRRTRISVLGPEHIKGPTWQPCWLAEFKRYSRFTALGVSGKSEQGWLRGIPLEGQPLSESSVELAKYIMEHGDEDWDGSRYTVIRRLKDGRKAVIRLYDPERNSSVDEMIRATIEIVVSPAKSGQYGFYAMELSFDGQATRYELLLQGDMKSVPNDSNLCLRRGQVDESLWKQVQRLYESQKAELLSELRSTK